MGARLPAQQPERGLVARLVYAAGDPALADLVRLTGDPIQASLDALRDGAPLIVDVGMVAAGISKPLLATPGCELIVALHAAGAESLARSHGITRSAGGILALADRLDGAVVVIGNAPTALLALLDLVNAGSVTPAAIVGLPVGFVAAEESKAALLQACVPSVTIAGTRGGSGLAAAAANYLLRLASEASPST
ncbi:MAG: precorrin-8X methylmutase [Chloroflexi bacterium]|nr:precorrin-8X methylmutase [Chloroflexota bacterium]